MRRSTPHLVTAALASICASGWPQASPALEWIHPNSGEGYEGLFADDEVWEEVLSATEVFGFFIGALSAPRDGEGVAAAVQFLTERGIAISVEAGGTLAFMGCDEMNGEGSAAFTVAELQPVYVAGGEVTYLVLDGPISRIIEGGRPGNCGFDLETAVQELVDFLVGVHEALPEVKIGLLTNFPNWSYGGTPSYQCQAADYGDYGIVLEAVLAAVAEAGEELHFVLADNPYDYAVGAHDSVCHADPTAFDWLQRLLDLEQQVEGHGLPFGMIYNSESGLTSDQGFFDDTVAYVETYQQAGGSPAIRVVESWYPHPLVTQPESQPLTFMATALAALQAMGAVPDSGPSCVPGPTALCLNQQRFHVEVAWQDFAGGSGQGTAVPFTADTGFFSFFGPDNLEVMVKVLDACDATGHFWVFFAAATNAGYTLTITDTERGDIQSYSNPLGTFAPAVGDVEAFATCDGY